MITVTDKAYDKIQQLLTQEEKPAEEYGLRVGVMGGGCSGFQYQMDFDTKRDTDSVFDRAGVRVFVDPKSMEYLKGSELDYVESLMGAGFKMGNPNVTDACGCGQSFNV